MSDILLGLIHVYTEPYTIHIVFSVQRLAEMFQ